MKYFEYNIIIFTKVDYLGFHIVYLIFIPAIKKQCLIVRLKLKAPILFSLNKLSFYIINLFNVEISFELLEKGAIT